MRPNRALSITRRISCRERYLSFPNCALRSVATTTTTKEPTTATTLELYDSLSEKIKRVETSHGSRKGLACYTCGPTVYGPTHLGHARTYVCLDILRRVLERTVAARPPLFVMNITDVDDKILNAAVDQQRDPIELARDYETAFWRDLDALNCLRPHVVTRVTEHVDSHIVPFIERLVDRGMAYVNDDQGVYFDVKAFEEQNQTITRYGKLAPPAQASTFYSRLEDQQQPTDDDSDSSSSLPSQQKRDMRDFVLWKFQKPDEALHWDSPWGKGRPGWHIECSAMIQAVQERFGDTHRFTLHAGGIDLKFPHHTNEIAQSEAYDIDQLKHDDGEWIPHWVHFGHLHIDGLKMSKSLKNFVTVQEMLQQQQHSSSASSSSSSSSLPKSQGEAGLASPADDFRLWCLGLSGPYRGPATYSADRLAEARHIRGRIVRFLLEAEAWIQKAESDSLNTKVWTHLEMQLFQSTQKLSSSHLKTLLADLDGSSLLKDINALVAEGTGYIKNKKHGNGSVESLQTAVRTLREVLELVGFSSITVNAGKAFGTETSSRVVGGEAALLERFVDFRDHVRRIALEQIRAGSSSKKMNEILKFCDDVRDETFPSVGVALVDGKLDGSDHSGRSTWKYCVPKETNTETEDSNRKSHKTGQLRMEDLQKIPLDKYFKSSMYEGQFSMFDENGIPTHNADGTEVSKRQLKKLLKKRAMHERRLKGV